jgi:F420H(2)-dependent quinone reductase
MKHQIVHTLQKYFLNPPIKLALATGLPLPGYALLETKGRKTGKARRTPVGDGRIGKVFWLVSEHGMRAGVISQEHPADPYSIEILRQVSHLSSGRVCDSRPSFA